MEDFEERDSSEEEFSSTSEEEEEEIVEFKPKGDDSKRTKQSNIGDDSSEEWPEGITRNTVGNIPLEWYDDYDHIGYDINGNKILKSQRKDEIEEFLAKTDDPNYWKTIYDAVNDRDVVLTDKQISILRRIQKGQLGVESDPNDYLLPIEDYENKDWFHPASNAPPPKSRFLPSKWEAKRIAYLVKAMRGGWIKLPEEEKAEREKKREKKFYNLWAEEDQLTKEQKTRKKMHIEAPKIKMPSHAESYNPPVEYLMTEEGIKSWKEAHPEDRRRNFIPQKFNSMREVPRYTEDIKERFERCLDLYLCPRQVKTRRKIKPEKLLPQVPKPQDLRPFPTRLGIVYEGHTERVRSISPSPTGEYMVSGSEDNTIKIWEVETGRCLETHKLEGVIQYVAWNPNPEYSLIAVAIERSIIIITPLLSSKRVKEITDGLFKEKYTDQKWVRPEKEQWEKGHRAHIEVDALTSVLKWHPKGDYLVSVAPKSPTGSVMIHRVSQQKTQVPFKKDSGLIQSACFHPRKPIFFVATQRYVKIYNLQKQKLIKKLSSGAKWISSIDVHPDGDNVIIGSYDSKVCWFDLDLSKRPYKTLRYHKMAVRNVIFHQKYPLFATCSDDGVSHIFHNTVYDDLLKNPLIVPVKILRGHTVVDNLGVIDCKWHPLQPWLFTSGSDNKILLFTT